MVKTLKEIIFAIVVAVGMVGVYNISNISHIRWCLICTYTFIAIALSEVILKEEPGELFDNFTIENWKKAKVSSILMIIEAISIIGTIVSLYIAIMNNR